MYLYGECGKDINYSVLLSPVINYFVVHMAKN